MNLKTDSKNVKEKVMLENIKSFIDFSKEIVDDESMKILFSKLYLQVYLHLKTNDINITNAQMNNFLFDEVYPFIRNELKKYPQ